MGGTETVVDSRNNNIYTNRNTISHKLNAYVIHLYRPSFFCKFLCTSVMYNRHIPIYHLQRINKEFFFVMRTVSYITFFDEINQF